MRYTLTAVLFLTITISLRATSFVATDLGELTRDARTIARGVVVAVDSRWSDDRSRIETLVTLEAEQYLKGSFGPTVQFSVPGGRVGRYRSIVVGAPQFTTGDRVVVFLAGSAPNLPHVIGLSQGLFRVVSDSEGWKVTPPPIVTSSTRIVRGDPTHRPMALEAFEQQVRSLVGDSR